MNTCPLSVAVLVTMLSSAAVFGQQDDPRRDAVVRIHVTRQAPDLYRPWTKQPPAPLTGTGVVIEGDMILTNAHVVSYATDLLIESEQLRQKIPAEVIAMDHAMDLAILRVPDASFFEKHTPVRMKSELPDDGATVLVYGYPMGGDALSITEGIVSRVEFALYGHQARGLRIQIDAAVNPGNSGGPAFLDDTMIGVVFSRMNEADNIAYIIPVEEIRVFLDDVADGTVDGKRFLPSQFQTLESPALRASLRVPDDASGMVAHPWSYAPSDYPLQRWDVVTHVGDHALDNRGLIDMPDGRRLQFAAIVQRLAAEGPVSLGIWRDGVPMTIEAEVLPAEPLLLPYLENDRKPSYFIYGPLVLSAATQEFAAALDRADWGPRLAYFGNPLLARRWSPPTREDEELVLVTMPALPHSIFRGYDISPAAVVDTINGEKVHNLRHLAELIRDADGPFITIEFAGRFQEPFVFDREGMTRATEEILERNGIAHQMSADLRELWTQETN